MSSTNSSVRRAVFFCNQLAVISGLVAGLGLGSMQGQAAPPASTGAPINIPVYQPRTNTQAPLGSDAGNEANRWRDEYGRADSRLATTLVATTSPTEFQQIVASTTGRPLRIFGADLFLTVPSTFSPVDNIPVTPEYVIGPGDELQLQVWGQVNQSSSYTVDRTGNIYLTSVGPIHVAGVQFAQLRDFLKSQLSRVYRNFDLNVNMGQLRSIQVFVVGQARQPGSYTVGSLSTLLNALFASGGPLPQGSLRDIQVRRGEKTVIHFDLYDLLLHGDKSKDVRLESGDVIFIPNVGPQAAILGSVNNPAIYELHGEKDFEQVIALAGGRTSLAAGSSVRVERISDHKERSVVDVNLSVANAMPIQDGDIITVSPIVDRFKDAVTLRGNVANPGRYSWFPGMRISDLIPNKEALITRNYYEKTNELGQNNTDYRGVNREGALGIASGTEGTYSSGMQPGNQGSNQNQNTAFTTVNTATTNSASGNSANESSADQSGQQGPGATDATSANARRNATTGTNTSQSAGAALTAKNSLFAPSTDVILQAPDIDWSYAVIERQSPDDLHTSLVPFNIGKAILDKDATQNLELHAGDVVTIFSQADIHVPNAQQTRFVRLEGEFGASGVYSILPGETLRQLLQRVGGFTPEAYLYASEFTRQSVKRLQKQRLNEYADQLESQITTQTSAAAASALNGADATAAEGGAKNAQTIVARLRQAEPSGRIVLDVKPDSRDIASLPDLQLEDGDRFVVPRIPSSVGVEGQVYNANSFVWQRGKRVKNYLEMAGGPERSADRKRSYVLRADGSVFSSQYGNFNRAVMYPGDTIVVPPVVVKGNALRELGNIATILAGFGVTAAAIEVLR
jgi:protein involved in polysaccharide export with SLBB domain